MNTIKLYEIADAYQELLPQLFNEETGEINDLIMMKLNAYNDTAQNKCINVVKRMKSLEAALEAIEKERKAMQAREKAIKSEIEWQREYLLSNMERCEITKIECPQFVISLQKSPMAVNIVDGNEVPEAYKKVKVENDITKIKQDLMLGLDVPGATLIQRNSIRIR